MKQSIIRIAKPIGYTAVALIAAAAFLAASPEGWAGLKSALAGEKDGTTCNMGAKQASGPSSCSMKAKSASAAKEGATCSKSAKLTQASSKGDTCCASGKDAAAKSAGTCPMSGKTEGAATPAVDKGSETCAMTKTAEAGACSKSAGGETCPMAKTAEAGACATKAAGDACCEGKDILSVAKSHEDFSTLMLAAEKAGVIGAFSCTEPKTVYAPTNDAFKKIPAEQWTALLEDKEQLSAILARHIVHGVVTAEDLKKLSATKVGDGKELSVSTCSKSGTVSIGNAKVVRSEVASNGMIYAIDTVLMPEAKTAAAAPADAVKVATK